MRRHGVRQFSQFDGVNLTNQGARRLGDNKLYPIEFEKFGPRYIGGVRFNF